MLSWISRPLLASSPTEAGDFTHINGLSRSRVARLNPDGTTDYPFLDGLPGANGTVYSVAVQPDGKILLGGLFTQVNGVGRTNIARLNPDGSLDTGFQNGMAGIAGAWNYTAVNCIALQSDGKILVAGSFLTVNGTVCSNIARLDLEGNLDTTFQPVRLKAKQYWNSGGTFYFVPSIRAMLVEQDDSVVIAGVFDENVLHLNSDGTVRATFDLSSLFAEGGPGTLCLDTNGDIIVGGANRAWRQNSYPVVARLCSGGYQSFSGLSSFAGGITSVAALRDGSLLAGGGFSYQGRNIGIALVHFDPNGTVAQYIMEQSIGITGGGSYTMAMQGDGKVLVGGLIVGSRTGILRLNSDTTFDSSFANSIPTTDGGPNAVAVQPDGKLVIAGAFTMVHGTTRNHVARLFPDGAIDPTFQDPLVGGYDVFAAALQPDGRVLFGGSFTTVGRATHVSIARLNPDGSADSAFQAEVYWNYNNPGTVYTIALQPDWKVLIGGTFLTVNGMAHTNIARLNSDGAVDNAFQAQASGDALVGISQIALQSDGKVLIAGGFSQVNGQSRQYLARLNPDGTLDDSFAPPPQPGIPAVVLQPDGKILLGNSRLNPDGSLDPTFHAATPGGFILLQPDGRIVQWGPTNIVRLNSDGSLDPTFQGDQTGFPLALQADGKILITGDGNILVTGVLDLRRLWGADFPPVLTMPKLTSAGEQLSWHAISNRTYRVQHTDTLGADTWATLSSDVLATNDVATTIISSWGIGQKRFYRVQALP